MNLIWTIVVAATTLSLGKLAATLHVSADPGDLTTAAGIIATAALATIGALIHRYLPWLVQAIRPHAVTCEKPHLIPKAPRAYVGATPGKMAAVLCNGIFSKPTDWQIPWVQNGNANYPQLSWSLFHYDADAMLTGLWRDQHAKELASTIEEARQAGATFIILVVHSEALDVANDAMQKFGAVVDDLWAVGGADYPDCGDGWWSNGMNKLIAEKKLGRVICCTSTNDGVLGGPSQWFTPYFWGKIFGLKGPKNTSPASAYIPHAEDGRTHLTWFNKPDRSPDFSLQQTIVKFYAPDASQPAGV